MCCGMNLGNIHRYRFFMYCTGNGERASTSGLIHFKTHAQKLFNISQAWKPFSLIVVRMLAIIAFSMLEFPY